MKIMKQACKNNNSNKKKLKNNINKIVGAMNKNKKCLNNSSQKTEKQNRKNFGTKTFKDCIPVKMRLALECNKELRSICVRTTISHRKNARSIMC